MLLAIQILLGVLFAGTGIGLVVDLGKNRMDELKGSTGKQWASAFTVGIIANFLDTLGCGSYAPSTFMYKLFNQIDDIDIPGTLNIGDTFPVIFEAFIFTTSVECDPLFLWVMFICAAVGSFGFASIVTKWPRNKIRIALGCAMLPLAVVMLCKNLGVGPFGLVGTAVGLTGWKLIVAAALNVLWGALMDIGFGLYAPCMATCLLLGVDAQTCFPVFMGSCQSWGCLRNFGLRSPASFAARPSAATPEKCRCATRGKSSPCPFGASGSKSSPPGPRSRKGPRKVTDAMVRAAQLDRSRRQGQALSAAISVVRAPVVVLSHDSCILPPPTGGPVRLPERRKHVKENADRRHPFRGDSGGRGRRNQSRGI